MPVTSFYCLTLLERKSITMNGSGKSRRPCLVLICQDFTIKSDASSGLFVDTLYQVKAVPFSS